MSEWIDIPEIKDLKVKIDLGEPGFTVSRNISLKEFDKLKEIIAKKGLDSKSEINVKGIITKSGSDVTLVKGMYTPIKGTAVLPPDHPFKKPKDEFEHLAPDHPWRRGTVPVFNG